MKTYQLDIGINCASRSSKLYQDCLQAANIIEMRQSEYFVWDDDEQEPLSRSNAIHLALKEFQDYPDAKEFLNYLITEKHEYKEDDDSSRPEIDSSRPMDELILEYEAELLAKLVAYEASPQGVLDGEREHAIFLLKEQEEEAYQDSLTTEGLKAYLKDDDDDDEEEDDDE